MKLSPFKKASHKNNGETMHRNSHTNITKLSKLAKKKLKSALTIFTLGIDLRQWVSCAVICAILSPILMMPGSSYAATPRTDPANANVDPVNEDLPLWTNAWRKTNAEIEAVLTPWRFENWPATNNTGSDVVIPKKKPYPEAVVVDSEKLQSLAGNVASNNKTEKPADESSEKAAGKTEVNSPIALMSVPAERPILDDSQLANLFSPENNLGNPLGQTESKTTVAASATRTRERAGIGNFSFGLSAASLPGRNLNAGVDLSYNSQLWTKTFGQFTYNVDGNWLAPGFNLGYGYLDVYRDGAQLPSMLVLTDMDGTRHQLDLISGESGYLGNYLYEANDGSFTRAEFTYCGSPTQCVPEAIGPLMNLRVTNSDGSKVFFSPPNAQNRYFPTKVRDVQGNYISINYLSGDQVGKISSIRDTLGRDITLHYDSSTDQKLIAITVPGLNGSADRQTIRFYYESISLQSENRFEGTIEAPSTISVLKYVYYPGTKTGFRYDYSPYYGMIYRITQLKGVQVTTDSLSQMGNVLEGTYLAAAWTRYNYPGTDIEPPSPTLIELPKYNKRIDDWVGRTGTSAPEVLYSVSEDSATRTTQTTTPDNTTTVSVSHKKPGQWDDGLVKETYVTSAARMVPWTKSLFTWQYGEITRGRRNPRLEKVETTNDVGLAQATTYSYDGYNNQTSVKEHDYAASGQVGTELRRTEISYLTGGQNNFWIQNNLIHLPISVKKIVANATVSRTDFEYDNSPLTLYGANAVVQYEETYNPDTPDGQYCHMVCPQGCEDPVYSQNCLCDRVEVCDPIPVYNPLTAYRGNVTKVKSFVDPNNNDDPNASIATTKYDIAGNVVEASLSCCSLKTSVYSASNKYAYAISETKGSSPQLITSATYDFNTGLILTSTNENSQVTTYEYETDTLRPKKTVSPNGGYIESFYSDKEQNGVNLLPGYVRQKTTLETNKFSQSYRYFNGRGEGLRSANETPDGWLISAMEYDNLGRARKSFNPFYGTTPTTTIPSNTKYTETTSIDALGRSTELTLQDATKVYTYPNESTVTYTAPNSQSITGIASRVKDQADKERRQIVDSLGRVVRVDEPTTNGLGTVSSPNQPTFYEYDGNDNLSKVIQSDGTVTQERKFKYDSLSRLTHEKQVEAIPTLNDSGDKVTAGGLWTKVLKYNVDGLLIDAYDARGVHSGFDYDGLNRIKHVEYSDGTPKITYSYDQSRSTFFNTGALTRVETEAGGTGRPDTPATATEFDYDQMGRVKAHRQTIGSQTYPIEYSYNLAGQMTSEKYPSGKIVSTSYDANGRLSGISDQSRSFLSGLQYQGKGGAVSSMSMGNGTTQNVSLNDRFQMTNQTLVKGSDVLQQYDYSYGTANLSTGDITASKNNGQLAKIESHIGTAKQWSQRFGYDQIGRLAESREYKSGNNSNLTYKQNFDFDPFGNMFRKAAANTTSGQEQPLPYTPIETADITKSTNRFATNTTYDDAGNVVTDNKFRSMSFAYDANGRMIKAIKASSPDAFSTYDASGMRVAEKVNDIWRFLIYDIGGKLISEYGGLQSTDDGGVKHLMSDWQGSTRTVLSNSGFVTGRADYSAFGEDIGSGTGLRSANQGFGSATNLRQKYGLTERDDATGMDHTIFRKHENRAGRWTSPDPYKGSMSLENPQSFNGYSYVGNQPLDFVDPSGLLKTTCYWAYWVYEDGTMVPGSFSIRCFTEDNGMAGAGIQDIFFAGGGDSIPVVSTKKFSSCFKDKQESANRDLNIRLDTLRVNAQSDLDNLRLASYIGAGLILGALVGVELGPGAIITAIAGAAGGAIIAAKQTQTIWDNLSRSISGERQQYHNSVRDAVSECARQS